MGINRKGLRMSKYNTWLISGIDVPTIKVNAPSFDGALQIARRINPRYDTGQVTEYDKTANWYFKGDNKFIDDVLKLNEWTVKK